MVNIKWQGTSLLIRILNFYRKHERKIRKGYMGQLTKIANKIVESRDHVIQEYIETHDSWREFVENQLAEINQRNDIKLGGRDPRGHGDDDFQDSHNPSVSYSNYSSS